MAQTQTNPPISSISASKMMITLVAVLVMLGISFMPDIPGLSSAGQRILGILAFSVIVWVSESIPFPVSGISIIVAMLLLLGFAPAKGASGPLLGTGKAIPLALGGFLNGGWILVAAGLAIAAGILSTGLEKRIALNILKMVGPKTNNIFAGMILVMLVLDFFIPSITARSATLVPIAMGLLKVFNVEQKSVFGRNLLVTVAISSSISGIAILTAGAPNPVALGFIQGTLHHTVTWLEWAEYGMPFSLALSVVFYFLVTRMNKFEFDEVPGGQPVIDKACSDLGPMSPKEKRIAVIFAVTIILWATESLHHIDANSVAIISVMLMIFPVIGVTNFKEMSSKVDWGTLLLFAAGLSLGEALLATGAAVWLAKVSLGGLGLGNMVPTMMMVIISAALLIMRFAFTSITSATAALVPTVLGFLVSLNNPDLPVWGMTLLATFTVYFAFILPVTSPQNMIPYATETFDVKDMAKVGIPLTIIGFALFVVFSLTYWHWLGLV